VSHWAEIDENNVVLRVVVGNDEHPDEGYQWLVDNLGGTWVKTSYNTYGGKHENNGTPLHKNFAGAGMQWDGTGFFGTQPFPSWVLDQDTYFWEAPVPYPKDGKVYAWYEPTLSWKEIGA
jgi:hypothetical protein